jgi:hypothetical protein
MTNSTPRMYLSNVNFAPASKKDTLLNTESSAIHFGPDKLLQMASAAGAGGLELTPIRSRHYQAILAKTEAARRLARANLILHEGWQGVPDPRPAKVPMHPRSAAESKDPVSQKVTVKMLFPHGEKGMRLMGYKLRALGNTSLKHVVYTNTTGDVLTDLQKAYDFEGAMIQPNPDVLAAWDVDSPKGLVNALHKRRLRVSWDNFQATRRAKFSDMVLDQRPYLETLLEEDMVDGVRIGLFRDDFKSVDPERCALSSIEGIALMQGREITPQEDGRGLDQTFKILKEHGWQGDVTIAAPLGGIQRKLGMPDYDADDITSYYGGIIGGIQQHMDWIPTNDWQQMSYRDVL